MTARSYHRKFEGGGAFLAGISNKTCPMEFDPSKGFLLRHIEGAEVDGENLTVDTNQAKYDQVYEDAEINYTSSSESCGEDEENIDRIACVGLNTNKDLKCAKAVHPIDIYSNGIVSLTCDDCYVGL